MALNRSLRALIRLGRLATDPSERASLLDEVAEAAVREVGSRAAVILLIERDATRVVASHGCRGVLDDWTPEVDLVGEELECEALRRCGGAYTAARAAVLASSGELFGSIVLLFDAQNPLENAQIELLAALADLTATSLVATAQLERLEQTNAELRSTKLAVARSEKLRALGEMAAGISHDLKNLLNPLSLHLQLLQRQLRGADPSVLDSLSEMTSIVKNGSEMLERLRQFSRQTPDVSMGAVSLDAVAEEAISIAKPRMSSKSGALPTIVRELGQPPQVLAQRGEVVSAVVNLIVNAIDALESPGKITVRTGSERGGSWIEVADTGPGISAEVREHVFEPFFTTKGEAGTGLGLAMVYACMVRHSGTAEVTSEPGRGACFRLWFPAARP
ncbi:MAG: HAMP domain-containing histidine kinase [Myxococcales bacterium]|nr:HAMP domain-containing histidine kinase [Myxococcales bacterium]